MKNLKLLLSRILPCLLVVACVFTFVSCKPKDDEDTYPKVSPTVSDPEGTFMSIGNYKVTRKTVYDRLVQNYGLDVLEDMINKSIVSNVEFDSHYSLEDFETNYEIIKYGADPDDSTKSNKANLTAEQIKEADDAFLENMRANGYFSEETYKEEYYKLSYLTMNYVVKEFKKFVEEYNNDEDNEEPYYSEEDMRDYYEANNRPKVTAIVITFDSEYQALQEMKNVGINVNKLNGTWEINNASATPATLEEAFKAIYKNVYGNDYETHVYTSKELSKISSVIASKAYDLSKVSTDIVELNKSYTHGPLVAGSRYYLMLKLDEDATGITKYEDLTDKSDILHALVENTISEYYITKILGEAHVANGLKIYDEGLESKYVIEFNAAYSNLKITDYEAFPETTEESATVVASYQLNGQTVNITADQLYDQLVKQYGSALSLSILQQYSLLSNKEYNSVIDFTTDEILDQDKFDEYYKADVQQFKTSFEEGKYATNGYPASYGWEHFIHDYLGVNSEMEIMKSMDSSLMETAKDVLARTIWTNTKKVVDEETNEETEVIDDEAIQKEMENIFNEFFSVSMVGVYVYYDKNEDGVADHYSEGANTDALSTALLNKIYTEAEALYNAEKNLDTTFESALSQTVNAYKLAASTSSVWGTYKKAGLKATAIASTNYTNSSSINETLKAALKDLWKKAWDIDSQKLASKSLDPGYRYKTDIDTISSKDIVSFEENVLVTSKSGIVAGDYLSFAYENKDYTRKVLEVKAVDSNYTVTLSADEAPLVNYYTPLNFTSGELFINNTADEDKNANVAYKVSLTKIVDHTYLSGKTYKPTLEDYEKYVKDNSSVTPSVKTAITTYYVPAIENVLSINGVSEAKVVNKILEACEANLLNTSWGANGEQIKAQLLQLIEDSYNSLKEE